MSVMGRMCRDVSYETGVSRCANVEVRDHKNSNGGGGNIGIKWKLGVQNLANWKFGDIN